MSETKEPNRYRLYITAQCLVLLNCYICFLNIYETHIQWMSIPLIGMAAVFFFLSGVYRNFRITPLSAGFIILFCYLLASDLITGNITTLTSQMSLSGILIFFLFSFFSGNKEQCSLSIRSVFANSVIISVAISFYTLLFTSVDELMQGGITVNRNSLATMIMVGIIGSVILFDRQRLLSGRNLFFAASFSINWIVLIKSESRTPVVVFACFLIILLFDAGISMLGKRVRTKILIPSILVLCTMVAIACILFVLQRNNMIGVSGMTLFEFLNRVSSNRVQIWRECCSLIPESPLVGVRYEYFDQVMISRIGESFGAHNVYISLLTFNGIPALIIYSAIIIYSVVSAIRTIKNYSEQNDKHRVYCYLAVLTGYLIGDMFECISMRLHLPPAFIVFLMFAAIDAEMRANEKQ